MTSRAANFGHCDCDGIYSLLRTCMPRQPCAQTMFTSGHQKEHPDDDDAA
jgi:hypothetical protein